MRMRCDRLPRYEERPIGEREAQAIIPEGEFGRTQAHDAAIGGTLVETRPRARIGRTPNPRGRRIAQAGERAGRPAASPPTAAGRGTGSIPRRRANCSGVKSQSAAVKPSIACATAVVSCIRLLPVGRLLPLSQRATSDLSTPTCWASFARLQLSRLVSTASLAAKSSTSADFGMPVWPCWRDAVVALSPPSSAVRVTFSPVFDHSVAVLA